jgi:predicted MPP superfamily phosphohydrolase
VAVPARRPLAALAGAGLAWGLFEAQWVECRTVDVPVAGLPEPLAGFRILHLSDFHLGSLSLNARALRKAVDWACSREPVDLVAVTGDLLSRTCGETVLRRELARLRSTHGTFVVLGNHDVGVTSDPFSNAREVDDLHAAGATVLRDTSVRLDVDGLRVQVVGVNPRTYMARVARPDRLADPDCDLRILLCHFPRVVDRGAGGVYQLVLAGHIHAGQICLPYPGGKVRFGEFHPAYPEGVYRFPETTLVVSRGIGTAFVPFRFFARPEAAELVLRRAPGGS